MDKAVWKEKNALAWSVAILAGFWTWVTNYPAISFWIPGFVIYLTWASAFLAGGGVNGFKASLTMNITGAVWAYVGIWVAGFLSSLGFFAMPTAIFLICLPLCWMAVWKSFELTPCGFIGAASLFAVFNSVALNPTGVNHVFVSTLIAIVLGNATLFACEFLINKFMGTNEIEEVEQNV